MPITPYNSPVRYKYNTLGLEGFASPLSKLQEQFDVTKAAIDAEDFQLSHLPFGTDPQRAQEILNTVKSKRDELATNLLETKNFREAQQKLLELRRLWKNDPESLALKSNYETYQQLIKKEQERVDKGEISRDQFTQWKNRLKDEYTRGGGAAFKASPETRGGEYTKIDEVRIARLKNLDKEIEETRFKIMNAQPEKVRDIFSQAGITMSPEEVHSIETLIKEKRYDELKSETEAYLRRYPGFNEYLTEVADYNLYDITRDPEKYQQTAKSLVTSYLNESNEYLKRQEAAAQKGNKEAKKYLESEDYNKLKSTQAELNNMILTGNYDENIVQNLFTEQHLDKVFDSGELADILAYKNVTSSHSFRNLPDGDGDDEDPLETGGMFTPSSYEKFDVSGIGQQRNQSGKNLYSGIKEINKLANGAMGLAIMGKEGSAERNKLLKDPAAMYERGNQILSAYANTASNGGTYKDFHNSIKNLGISEQLAATLFKDFSQQGGYSVNKLASQLQQGEYDFNNYVTSKDILEGINKGADENTDYNNVLDKYGREKPLLTTSINPAVQRELDKQIKLFSINSYSKEQLKKAGINPDNYDYNPGRLINKSIDYGSTLTFDEVARLRGYKDAKDAVKKGYNFNGAKLENDQSSGNLEGNVSVLSAAPDMQNMSNNLKQQLLNQNLIKNEQAYRYIGDKKVDKTVNTFFLQGSDLSNFEPAYTSTQQGQTGFDDEGRLLPSTQLDITDNKSAKLVKHGNSVYYEVPIKYKDEDGQTVETTVTLKPKKGSEPVIERLLNQIDIDTQGGDKLDAQTNQMIKSMKFNNRFTTNFSKALVDGVYIDEGKGSQAVVTSLPSGFPGTNLNVVKVSTGDGGSTLKVAISNGTDTPVYLQNPETGKDFYSSDPEVVKAFIASQLQL